MIELFRKYNIYYVLTFLLIILGLVLLLVLPKGGLVLWLDVNSNSTCDTLFHWVTKGGEPFMGLLAFILILLFSTKRLTFIFIVSILLALIVSQGLKHKAFPNEDRPSYTYTELHEIADLDRHTHNSFPSGHTTAAFTFFTLLAISFRKKWLQFLAPCCAAMVGVSRVYLGQHYLIDIVAGAVLGVFIVSIVVYFFNKKMPVVE